MLNTFALESSVLMLLNISLSNSTGRARALFERRDSESSKCSKQHTIGGRGRMRSTRNRGTREKTRENRTKRRRHRAAKGRRGKERKEGTRKSNPMPFSGYSLFQVCLLLSVKPWEEPSCIMQLHVTERWGLGANHGGRPYHPVMPEFIK